MKQIDLVILAGGKGTRIRKFSNFPKPVIKFNKLYFLDYLIQNYSTYDFQNIYVIAGYKGNQIKKIYSRRIFNLKKIKVIIEKKPMDMEELYLILKISLKTIYIN